MNDPEHQTGDADLLELRTDCAPTANGRQPEYGDLEWAITFRTEDGRTVRLIMGKRGHDALRFMLLNEEVDDAIDEAAERLGPVRREEG